MNESWCRILCTWTLSLTAALQLTPGHTACKWQRQDGGPGLPDIFHGTIHLASAKARKLS